MLTEDNVSKQKQNVQKRPHAQRTLDKNTCGNALH